MRFSHALFFLSVLIGLFGCQNKQAQEPGESDDGLDISKPTGDSGFSMGKGPLKLRAEAMGQEAPHQYQVHLSWESAHREPSVFYIIKRNDWNEGRVVQGDQSFFRDQNVEEGKSYHYQVQMLNGSKNTQVDWVDLTVPKDFVFSAGENLFKGKMVEYRRVFFEEGARVHWQGGEFYLEAGEIISKDAVLESFSASEKVAPVGQPGKSGGLVTVKAKKLTGTLYLRADGQHGGEGEVGAKGEAGPKGPVGPDTFLRWGDHNSQPQGAHLHRGYYFLCDPPRAPGGPGGEGKKGGLGANGRAGGNSGKIHVEIERVEGGELYFTQRPGVGGNGGAAGEGGDGGEGGDPGKIDWRTFTDERNDDAQHEAFHQCQHQKGAQGPKGPIGEPGQKGEDGYQAPYCLKLGSSKTGNCLD